MKIKGVEIFYPNEFLGFTEDKLAAYLKDLKNARNQFYFDSKESMKITKKNLNNMNKILNDFRKVHITIILIENILKINNNLT